MKFKCGFKRVTNLNFFYFISLDFRSYFFILQIGFLFFSREGKFDEIIRDTEFCVFDEIVEFS